MTATGELILVTGFYGAGKSTLTHAALETIDNLKYLHTITTRPPRPEEIERGSIEYEFVTPEEYATRQAASRHWDHMHLQGYSYGADVDRVNQQLASGISIICCIAPDEAVISQMSSLYATPPVVVWVDTPLVLANERLLASGSERRVERTHHRLQTDSNAVKIKELASAIFDPTGSLKIDETEFIHTVRQIITSR